MKIPLMHTCGCTLQKKSALTNFYLFVTVYTSCTRNVTADVSRRQSNVHPSISKITWKLHDSNAFGTT